jgi:hypothetical protein
VGANPDPGVPMLAIARLPAGVSRWGLPRSHGAANMHQMQGVSLPLRAYAVTELQRTGCA